MSLDLDLKAPQNAAFELDSRIKYPETFKVVFVILLDGDLVMSPEHLGVAYMAAVLRRAGFTCRIEEVVAPNEAEAIATIAEFAPDLICFTLMSLNIGSWLNVSAQLKSVCPDARIACGGPAGTYTGLELLRINPHADIVAVGEGEPTIFELVQHLYLDEPLSACRGIGFRTSAGEVVATPVRALLQDLETLPFPARDQLEKRNGRLEYVRVSTSRGCIARCTFCSAPHAGNRIQHGKAWRGRSAESVVDELEHLVKTYRFRTFDFVDSTFEDPDGGRLGKARIRKIAEGILERGLDIYYNVCMRAENWSDADDELLELLVRSGLEKVNVGIESGTEVELRLWEKRATVEDNARIIEILRRHGIYLAMGFIQFHPYSTVETLVENARFLRHNGGYNLRRLTERLEIYPGTPLAQQLERDGLLTAAFHSNYDHYGYTYRDEAVDRLAKHFASLYNDEHYHERGVITERSSVFEFETFNVVLSTFLSRSQRRFGHLPGVVERIEAFRHALKEHHDETAAFNHAFFMYNVDKVFSGRLNAEDRLRDLAHVEAWFGGKITQIKSEQMRLARDLMRAGADLTQIDSTEDARNFRIARTYVGGGTPCW